ncbi:hypothetical protein JD844_008114 [Phrynosoma platyrhinos]|uniref:Nucleolar protein 6 n=1 Tax=Phrynosoma platyrhinos TaxID=52577 RepID=A0ABQ7TDS7_PHRPL|nr:hypothetical protein JD844_008114 [Phrynosoma platyrhinos]
MPEDAGRDEGLEGEGDASFSKEERKPRGEKRPSSVSEGVLQPVKLCKAELYKPPTNEELSRLKETENLFHSNLLRLQEVFQDKDNLNQRYHRKRALYLTHIAHHLAKKKLFGSVKFAYMNGNHLKPMVLLQPRGKDAKIVTVRLFACPAKDVFKPSRLHPSKNNIRTAWFTEKDSPVAGATEPPTPHYNNSILWDLVMESNLVFLSEAASGFQGMRDGCFSGFLASMLVGYLLAVNKINKVMSGYQVLRNALQFLDGDVTMPTLIDFHEAFQVVFVDPSGRVNLCADMTANTYKQIQFEAKHSMEILDDKTVEGFQLVFMTPKPLIQTFDHVFHLRHASKLQAACKKMKLLNELMDHGGNYVAATLPFLLSLLERGLAQRIMLLTHTLPQTPPWSINTDPPQHKDVGSLSFGLLLSLDFATRILERGPEADKPEAVEFRQFWGQRSELRRFQDGAICEAVLWDATNMSQKRLIPEQIIRHLLQLHMDIPESSICYTGALLESVIKMGREPSGTGEEAMVNLVRSYDDLSRKLWNLEGLPLTVTSVQGAHPALRYTDVFPPVPVKPDYAYHARIKDRESLLPLAEKPCPAYIAPMKGKDGFIGVVIGSGQWPQDKEAIKRIKAAFQVQLAELLHQQHRLLCRPSPTHTDVYKDGYVFRLQVAYHREPQILKEVVTPEGMLKYQDNPESQQLELETQHSPFLTSSLHGSPQVGFLRFLHQLTTFDWKNSPLIVNLNGELKDTDYVDIQNHFVAARLQLPVMFIATPKDQHNSVWTKEKPSAQILQRLLVLALESLRSLEEQLMNPLGSQDIKIPRHLEAVDRPVKSFSRGMLKADAAVKTFSFPVVDYDPVQCYLQELQEAFSEFALFFYDKYGGEVIGVLWKPSAFDPQPFKASNMRGRMMSSLNKDPLTVPNVEAILEDFGILGEGLVKSVEARTEKWSI